MSTKNGTRQKVIIISLVLGTLLFGYGVYYNQKYLNDDLKFFYQHKIEGQISSITKARSIIILTLKGHGTKQYIFTRQEEKPKQDFSITVHPGDAVYKNANSDTLTVINKQGVRSAYLIKKP
jgi:hypothetical protein